MQKILFALLAILVLPACHSLPKEGKTCSKVDVRTTAYTSCEPDHLKYKKKTAVGTTLQPEKSIATDWSQFPVGTVLKIDGRTFEVDDYGSAMVFSKHSIPTIDVYKTSRREMNRWGVRHFQAEVVQFGSYERSLKILKDRLRFRQCRAMYDRILQKI